MDIQPLSRPNPFFMFATGIENSYPTIEGGRVRVDEMADTGHYRHWRLDFDLVEQLGIRFLRYGPPLHSTWVGPDRYSWAFADATFGDLFRRDIVPIADLCHFGVPDWLGNFQNPDFPALFADYARAFAERFPWVQLYTPVNEMFVCALFSARYGWWNEQLTSDRAFVTALKHVVKANVLASQAILAVRPDAIFIQSESAEYVHARHPRDIPFAEQLNARRFLSLDLNYGHEVEGSTYQYLMDNGLTREDYAFFRSTGLKHHCILGSDYYPTNEHYVGGDGRLRSSGEVFGFDEIVRQYHARYRIPVMHTETNVEQGARGDEAVEWLMKQWANVLRVRNDGIPIVGFTWYSLIDQMDWDVSLRRRLGRVNRRGLFDLDRNIRPVGAAYRELVREWQDFLPAQSACLVVPFVLPSEYGDPSMQRRREWISRQHRARQQRTNPPSEPA